MDQVRVGDVDSILGGGEGDAVGATEAVSHDANVARRRVKAVHLLRKLGLGPEALLVAIDGVGEPDGAVRVYDNIVWRIERPRMIVVQERGGFMRPFGVHVDEARRFAQGALGAQDKTIAVVGAAVCHVVALGASDFVTGEVGWGKEFDFGDDNGFVMGGDGIGRGVGKEVRGDEERIGRRVEHAGFVEVRSTRVIDQELKGRRWSEKVEKGIVVYEKRLGLWGVWRYWG